MTRTERFWTKVQMSGTCWPWIGHRNRQGYGLLRSGPKGNQKSELAHRVSWEVNTGPIPDDLCVLHTCDNPPCVRPEHLFLGTRADNVRDSAAKGRMHPGELHGMSKLTDPDIRTIRASTLTQRELARHFGVDPSAISLIKNRKAWTHVL